jgi:gamma-glutamylcyclotransferase (GGCT)/AIG2-like uncharacterized protein YtfP
MAMILQRKTLGSDLLFVYGTLRTGCDNEQARALHARSRHMGSATLLGRLYRVDWYPVLVPDMAAGPVVGDVFHMHDPVETLAWLDAYEECAPPFPEPWEYRRIVLPVKADNGRDLDAWAYVYNRPVEGLPLIPDGDFLGE